MTPAPRFVIEVRGMPEVIWACRHEMAEFLRDVAQTEASPAVAHRLKEVAQVFETGQKECRVNRKPICGRG